MLLCGDNCLYACKLPAVRTVSQERVLLHGGLKFWRLVDRAILFTLSIALSYLNYRGLSIVGNAAVVSTVYIIIPFAVRQQSGLTLDVPNCICPRTGRMHAVLPAQAAFMCIYHSAKLSPISWAGAGDGDAGAAAH